MKENFVLEKKLDHIAFIMDGNGRWAKARGLARHFGHREACKRIREIFDTCMEFGISYSSYFAFSTENWNRPQDEIDHLMDYLEEFFKREIDYLCSKSARIVVSGDLGRIREKTRKVCLDAIERTKDNKGHVINICLNYGGRDEIVRAARAFANDVKEGKEVPEDLSEDKLRSYFWHPDIPDVDLLIRTSGEVRLSNFMLWQVSYGEFVFTPVAWPDFHREQMIDCLKEFNSRKRRYGGLKDA